MHWMTRVNTKTESKLRRLGTMFGGRRRQSMHGGISSMSPQKSSSGFGRIGSSHGRGVSPRASSSNLHESRLTSLAEAPDLPSSTMGPSRHRTLLLQALMELKSSSMCLISLYLRGHLRQSFRVRLLSKQGKMQTGSRSRRQ
jgi:hypothetical protein